MCRLRFPRCSKYPVCTREQFISRKPPVIHQPVLCGVTVLGCFFVLFCFLLFFCKHRFPARFCVCFQTKGAAFPAAPISSTVYQKHHIHPIQRRKTAGKRRIFIITEFKHVYLYLPAHIWSFNYNFKRLIAHEGPIITAIIN